MACCALVLVLAMQFVLPSQTPLPDDQGLAPRRARPVVAPPLPEYSAILAAPVFAPDRRPSSGGDSAQAAAAGFTILGIAVGRGVGAAVLKSPDGATHVMRPGDTVAGWRLVGLDHAHLILDRQGKRLSLAFDPDHPAPAGAASAANAAPDADQEGGQ